MHRLRAPQENRAILAEPPFAAVAPLLAENRRTFATPLQFLQVSWQELRKQAGDAALSAAHDYLRSTGEPIPEVAGHGLFLAGHQPELFHPGVWIKNFALLALAKKHGLVPLNLVVDSDTAKSTQLRLPADDHLGLMPFDHFQGEVPFEERRVLDEELFASLPERAQALTKTWPYQPMLGSFWQELSRQAWRTPLLGERFAAGRRAFERRWGAHGLEVPLSALCRTEPFAWFACHLLGDLPRFQALYNDAVHAYRREHDIHSKNHPVPDLASDGDWLEAPFWIWKEGQVERHRLFARRTPHKLDLRGGKDMMVSLELPANAGQRAVAQWLELGKQGVKIRTRALTTTLYARMLLGDTFLHGIGGAKYDELTDVLIERFYGVRAPGYFAVSATLLLPLPRSEVTIDDVRRLAREQRDLWWNPDRHHCADAADIQRKRELIARPCSTAAERRQRFVALRDVLAHMRPHAAASYENLAQTLDRSRRQLSENEVRGRRDYAFCLFPEADLREFLCGVKNLIGT